MLISVHHRIKYEIVRMDLRYYLTFGLLLTALADFLFGFAHTVGVHSVAYFYVMEAFLGIVNSSGWPGVVTTLRCERNTKFNFNQYLHH